MSARTACKTAHAPSRTDEARLHMAAASACFAVGDPVTIFDKYDRYVGQGEVVYEYDLYEVVSDDDAAPEDDEFRYGYIVRVDGKSELFYVPAHALTRDDDQPSYLRLVTSHGRRVGGGSPPERGRRC